MKPRLLAAVLLALVVGVGVGVAGCGGDDSDGSSTSSSDAKGAKTTATTDTDTEPAKTEPTETTDDLPPIQILKPAMLENVFKSFELSGTARTSDGKVAWAILDADREPLAEGTAKVSCKAPCRGTFATDVKLAKVPVGSWELHVWEPNATDPADRTNDTMTPITVTARKVDDVPDSDAFPPGGVPQQ